VSLLSCLVGGLLAAEPAPLGIVHKPIPDKLVILTFDDGCASHATFVAPILKEMGFGGSFYVSNFGSFSTRKDWYLTWQQMKEMADAGFEIGNHTHGHCGGASIGPFLRMEEQFSANGVPRTTTVCWPVYHVNTKTFPDLTKNGYLFGRGGHERPYRPEADHPLDIPSFTVKDHHTVTHVIQRVRQATAGRVVVLTFHGVPDEEHPPVSVEPALFRRMMQYLKRNGYKCISMRDLAKYVDPVKAAKLSPTQRNVKLEPTEPASEPAPMALSEMVEFKVWGVHTFRKGETIELVNINKVDITAIKPTIVVSPGATVAPASRQPVDLTTPKTYVVTASDGTTTKYTVSIRPKGESK
jgi:peptidoglycan/xylan/chitin deacetylase (PgdA/CDA1 family)